ncbi:Alpha/Beta hydrolase protein [Lasiosphaeris hirsuta]|uniref:Alpha/Beta hydrolase protein n=1 Tax=Lasiosphaeris hirsuta TaxID=260670 RepID=A0AA40AR00_9PEZI|nr:Alpha/Beta hydrolase protein [Lasiosphaeris hirsuta]
MYTNDNLNTFILLHGRGSSATKSGLALLSSTFTHDSNSTSTLRSTFPHAKFVFPTTTCSRATLYKRSIIHQWFDSWDLTPRNEREAHAREWLMIDGLQLTTAYLRVLLWQEVALVPGGAESVVLYGLSRGCAASLMTMLLWDGESLAGVVGMCGWLPFADGMVGVIASSGDGKGGREDDRVPLQSGSGSAACLKAMGVKVSWDEYQGLGHWYSGGMLADIAPFLQNSKDWTAEV